MEFVAEKLDWQGRAGRRLDEFARQLPASPRLEITVFGSTPLQLFVEPSFLSEDIDIFGGEGQTAFLERFVAENKWAKGETDLCIQVCDPLAFRAAAGWRSRAVEAERHGHLLVFVHPWDVLVSKLQRLEEKDIAAFRVVTEKTGHPTEDELIQHLQMALDLYRPSFDEESARGDMVLNTKILWRALWDKEIDVRARIIRPAVERAEREYREAGRGLKDRLHDLGRPGKGIY